MTDEESFVAFCGLFCGDCLIREGEVRHLSQELLRHLRTQVPQTGRGPAQTEPQVQRLLRVWALPRLSRGCGRAPVLPDSLHSR